MLGLPSSAETLTAIGDEGVLALVCDSTNVFQDTRFGQRGRRSTPGCSTRC